MNLIQGLSLIKEGILSDDIEKIKAGYELLSGESLPEEVREVRESDVEDDTTPTSNPTTTTATEEKEVLRRQQVQDVDFSTDHNKNKSVGGKYGRKESIQVRENQFIDDGTEAKDKTNITPDVDPVPRNRKPAKFINLECHACGKSFKVSASIARAGEYYRCDRCVG
jgi:hypothetical protein